MSDIPGLTDAIVRVGLSVLPKYEESGCGLAGLQSALSWLGVPTGGDFDVLCDRRHLVSDARRIGSALPTHLLDRSNLEGPVRVSVKRFGWPSGVVGRHVPRFDGSDIMLRAGFQRDVGLLAHELWHRFQWVAPQMFRVERTFLRKRREAGRPLFTPYAMDYDGREVGAVGLQAMVGPPLSDGLPDVEHRALVLGILACLGND